MTPTAARHDSLQRPNAPPPAGPRVQLSRERAVDTRDRVPPPRPAGRREQRSRLNLRPPARRLAAFLLGAACFAGVAEGQRLWSVDEVTVRPRPPVEAVGVLPFAATDGFGPLAAEAARIQVTFDYLRLGFGHLELPLADGTVIEAGNAVFEDRGDGNFLWTGEVPGAGYESVLFTVQDEHLVGWFGEPGGPKYTVHAGPDGRGTLAVEQGPTGNWCGVMDGKPPTGPAVSPAAARDRPDSVAGRSTGSSLDILALYPRRTEWYWRIIGGTSVGIQQLEDYLNMVFRNGQIPATANLIPERWDPVVANHPGVNGGHRNTRGWHSEFGGSHDTWRLQQRHQADLVHFLPDRGTTYVAGVATLRWNLEPAVHLGWSEPWPPHIFAHEIGHNLGGDHEPVTFSNFAEAQSDSLRPYIFGHTDLTSCAKREGRGDALYCPSTVMSYGQDLWDDPDRYAVTEPFYSSVRHKPNGWTIGVAGTSEVERLFHETVPVAVRSGEAQEPRAQAPRRITVRWTDRNTVRVSFALDQSLDQWSVYASVHVGLAGGGSDLYGWSFKAVDTEGGGWKYVLDEESTDGNVTPLFDPPDDFAPVKVTGVDITGLRPGGHYRYKVSEAGTLGSDVFDLRPPQAAAGAPAAPEHLSVQTTGDNGAHLTWRVDDSSPAGDFEVWYRKWSGDEPDEVWRRYGAALPASVRSAEVRGLAAEEEVDAWFTLREEEGGLQDLRFHQTARGRYSFVVVAYNAAGFSASETLDFEFMPGPFPEATPAGEVPWCLRRSVGLELDGHVVRVCLETPGGERRRAWDYGLEADQSGLLYFFDRDNVELLVKVLDGCAVNGHRWVFVAPVTTLGFRLSIHEPGPYLADRRQEWYYDSKRRPQEGLERFSDAGNPQGSTARTVSDTTAFPCTLAEVAAARAQAAVAEGGHAAFLRSRGLTGAGLASLERRSAGASTDCEPGGTALTLAGGYRVSMCYETYAGETGDALDWGLDSSQSALLYFFERNNAEVLIKVLDGCGVNGHRWVFVAPVTDLAFNLRVESPNGEVWTHTNRLGQTADAASDTSAFRCTA